MAKLAFSGKGKYPDFEKGYTLYCKRKKKGEPVAETVYNNIVRDYCKTLADRLEKDGMVDLPKDTGTLFTAIFRRKPQYRGNKFVGYGKINRTTGNYDGSPTAFGIVFLPKRNKTNNLRCFGFVANRRLFQRLKNSYVEQTCNWIPMQFNDKMI